MSFLTHYSTNLSHFPLSLRNLFLLLLFIHFLFFFFFPFCEESSLCFRLWTAPLFTFSFKVAENGWFCPRARSSSALDSFFFLFVQAKKCCWSSRKSGVTDLDLSFNWFWPVKIKIRVENHKYCKKIYYVNKFYGEFQLEDK